MAYSMTIFNSLKMLWSVWSAYSAYFLVQGEQEAARRRRKRLEKHDMSSSVPFSP